ncbi:Sn1-specific diacylglycerol lipase beta [Seminavis robusta]|uniref:Sn1-specific diacylglycerol lipase beta n=1 Tax=Seminavis robusta TaxID=568900 RepID=A0A9N8ED69_9STRA|nr:Sn1-specific diacylglycerol lipase beta [Seminavis robusta]|eukprot:Sro918_g220050.1 Sn1-specific diacylglycerol lipase beta (623) ;mRNA; r:32227-34224
MMYSRLLVRTPRGSGSSRSRILNYYPAVPVILTASLVDHSSTRTTTTSTQQQQKNKTRLEEDPNNKKEDAASKNNRKDNPVFDITQKWKEARNASDFWKSTIFTEQDDKKTTTTAKDDTTTTKPLNPQDGTKEGLESLLVGKMQKFLGVAQQSDNNSNDKTTAATKEDMATTFQDMAASFTAVLAGGGTQDSIQRVVNQARQSAEQGDVSDNKSLDEVLAVLKEYAMALEATATKFLGQVDLSNLFPTNLFYYVEHEDAVKNPSWKRRMHRFYPGIDLGRMEDLNDDLQLAFLSYADSVDEIQEGLENHKTPFQVVLVDTNSYPNRPAHFIAVKRSQPIWSPYLEVLVCVRGTKTIEDALTDLLCDDVAYKGGKAHSGVLEGGRYLAEKHKPLLLELLKSSGKPKMKVRLIGHSLGAGAASIIGMEWNDDPNLEVEVIGFGCPALLSKELSESTKGYITTVIADNDCVPRLSAAATVNALLDIMEFDYRSSARRDVKHSIEELQRMYPMIITKGLSRKITDFVDPLMEEMLAGSIKATSQKRMDPVLFPPGNIIHFYRDGVGVTGSVCPCEFFGELDINRRMVDDHLFFSGYQQIFLELMRQHHQDHYFSFDHGEVPTTKKK